MKAWEKLSERNVELDALASAGAVLEWDQQTYMPRGGAAARGQASAVLSRIAHERFVDPQVGDWLEELAEADLDAEKRVRRIHFAEALSYRSAAFDAALA